MTRKKKQKFKYISKTAINLWSQCPRHFYYKYISNTAKPTQKIINWRMILGRYIHHFTAYHLNRTSSTKGPFYFRNKYLAIQDWKKFYTSGVEKELRGVYKSEEGARDLKNSIAETSGFGTRAISNYWDIFINYSPPLEVEKYLSIDISDIAPGFWMKGTLDEIRFLTNKEKIQDLYPGTSFAYYPISIDLKTGGTKQYIGSKKDRFRMNAEDISRNLCILRADPQAIMYMELFNGVYRKYLEKFLVDSGKNGTIGPISFGILNLMSRETLIIDYDERNWLELQNTIIAIWNAVQYNEFPLKADVYRCPQCEYFHHCASLNKRVSIITHREINSPDEDIEVIVFTDNDGTEIKNEYSQKKLFRLPKKVLKEPQPRGLDEGIKRVVIID